MKDFIYLCENGIIKSNSDVISGLMPLLTKTPFSLFLAKQNILYNSKRWRGNSVRLSVCNTSSVRRRNLVAISTSGLFVQISIMTH